MTSTGTRPDKAEAARYPPGVWVESAVDAARKEAEWRAHPATRRRGGGRESACAGSRGRSAASNAMVEAGQRYCIDILTQVSAAPRPPSTRSRSTCSRTTPATAWSAAAARRPRSEDRGDDRKRSARLRLLGSRVTEAFFEPEGDGAYLGDRADARAVGPRRPARRPARGADRPRDRALGGGRIGGADGPPAQVGRVTYEIMRSVPIGRVRGQRRGAPARAEGRDGRAPGSPTRPAPS